MSSHSKDAVAERLAMSHYRLDSAIQKIIRIVNKKLEKDDSEPIKLLEVNADTTKQGIMPIGFGPNASSGIFYPSTIIEVHPDEFKLISEGKLVLPDDWEIGSEFPRPLAQSA